MSFVSNTPITYSAIPMNFRNNELELKNRVKYFVKTKYNYTRMILLTDFYFYYSKKNNINPVIPILYSLLSSGEAFENYFPEEVDSTAKSLIYYRNTAKIRVGKEIRNAFNEMYETSNGTVHTLPYRGNAVSNDNPALHYDFFYVKFESWLDSVRAQIDHLTVFTGNKRNICPGYTRKSFDPDYYDDSDYYENITNDAQNSYSSPTISAMMRMYNHTELLDQMMAYLNLIFYNTPSNIITVDDNNMFSNYNPNINYGAVQESEFSQLESENYKYDNYCIREQSNVAIDAESTVASAITRIRYACRFIKLRTESIIERRRGDVYE